MCCHHINRRQFMGVTTGMLAGAALMPAFATAAAETSAWPNDLWDPERPLLKTGKPLRVQPILMYRLPERREMSSWKSWGGIQTEEAVAEEVGRIDGELKALAARAPFPLEFSPVQRVTSPEEAERARADCDVSIVYPATGSDNLLNACVADGGGIVFIRHRSGPVYYWYEALNTRLLQPTTVDPAGEPDARRLSVDDVVVDDPDELLWRLRAFYAVKNMRGSRIVALGGSWGKYDDQAPRVANERYGMSIVDVNYDTFGPRIQTALADSRRTAQAERWTDAYLALPGTKLATERKYVVNSFVLYGLFKELMQENDTNLFTIRSCMGQIMPMSLTTACLALSLLNDEGYVALCESDFVIIPPGILLHYITGQPVFMHNSTFPHNGMVTCAHCTGPRRMDGNRYEPTEITTHYESEFGAAPKVDMPIGQELSFIDPEYATPRWVGIRGTVESNPYYDICRSQQDVKIHGNWKALLNEVRDSHWVMAYGDHLRPAGYAARKLGIRWDNVSEAGDKQILLMTRVGMGLGMHWFAGVG